jgi:hypothetical protein
VITLLRLLNIWNANSDRDREYQKITYDYPLAAARAFTTIPGNPNPFKFVYVSSLGATTTPGIFTAHFAVIKGRAEAALLALSKDPQYKNLRPFTVRPAMVDHTSHPEIHPFVPEKVGILKLIETPLRKVIKTTMSSLVNPTRDLGKVFTELASGDGAALEGKDIEGEGRTINHVGITRLARE